jgi:2-polyprenyl-3-methyl-5-hydroxy-6-metoxy-1,4-benzoquinol methylase
VAWIEKVKSFFRGTWLQSERQKWNDGYQRGKLDGLKDPAEEPRLDAVVTMLRKHSPHARVLEIGCGEALIQRRMTPADYTRWVGVDLSDVVIEQAQKYAGPNVTYAAGDMRVYAPAHHETFDAIMFTESINYVQKRDEVLQRYFAFLRPGGLFILSVYDQIRSPQIWSEVEAVLEPIDTVITENARGKWVCKVLKPRG